jgi:hypothetical protein
MAATLSERATRVREVHLHLLPRRPVAPVLVAAHPAPRLRDDLSLQVRWNAELRHRATQEVDRTIRMWAGIHWADGAWTPTFPNARYLVGHRELAECAAPATSQWHARRRLSAHAPGQSEGKPCYDGWPAGSRSRARTVTRLTRWRGGCLRAHAGITPQTEVRGPCPQCVVTAGMLSWKRSLQL